MIKYLKTLLILLPTFALAGAAGWFLLKPVPEVPKAQSKLLVIVVFDQMRGDYLERWAPAFGANGFERMKREGAWYSNCELPYACTATAPGHASLVTGATPAVHGIVENGWLDRDKGFVSCELDDARPKLTLSPVKMQAPSLSGSLKTATDGKGKFFSFSIKGRAAVLMGGESPGNIFCFNNGVFHNSVYYSDPPAWVNAFNKENPSLAYSGQSWDRVSNLNYDQLAGWDDQPGEMTPSNTLPRRLPNANEGNYYYSMFERSPFANELLWKFAKTAIEAEDLGNRQTTDVLALSFSANDIIGHDHGPDSHEVLDVTLRSDAMIAEMIKYLDDRLGREKYTLIVTADHGIAPLPEVAVKTHPQAARIRYSEFITGLGAVLDETFGKVNGTPGRWVLDDSLKETMPWIHLNRKLIEALDVPYEKVEAFTANWLSQRAGVQQVFTRSKLITGDCPLPEDRVNFDLVRNGFYPDRCGDIYIVYKPHIQTTTGLGVSHGTLHDYDRKVFILALGSNVPNLGRQRVPLNWLSVTPMACKTIGIPPPAKSIKDLPDGW